MTVKESLQAKLAETVEREKTAWFIERGQGEWFTGDARISWTRDPHSALHFCRKRDADTIILARDTESSAWKDCCPFATQHIFLDRPE